MAGKEQYEHQELIEDDYSNESPDRAKNSRSSKYQARFKDISAAGGLELEDMESEIDEKGEKKITKDGILLQGRQYRLPTFTLPRHPTRLYMLTVDVAKTLGFRDSYLFLLKNPDFPRLVATEEDRAALQELNIVPYQLKNRTIAITTARSIFRRFGHKIIKKGKPVRDDYLVGDRIEPVEESPKIYKSKKDNIYNENLPASDLAQSDSTEFREEAIGIFNNYPYRTSDNLRRIDNLPPFLASEELKSDEWMYSCAMSAAEFNRKMVSGRPKRFHDPHTNIEQFPKSTQPTGIIVEVSKNRENMDFGIVDKIVNTKPSQSEKWTCLFPTEESKAYPIAIMAGQNQFSFSLFPDRFVKSQRPVAAVTPILKIESAKSNDSIDSIDESSGPRKRVRNVENTCGAKTHSGSFCQRAVIKAGDRCSHHSHHSEGEDDGETSPQYENVCAHCHHEEAQIHNSKIPKDLFIKCSSCESLHHPSCMDFEEPVLISKVQTYDWLCMCSKSGNDDKLLFCDTCDRGYHTFCLNPPLAAPPEGSWLCELCATCTSCDKKQDRFKVSQDFQWKHVVISPEDKKSALGTYLCTYCKDCEKKFKADRFCPLCFGVYTEEWVHVGCDPELTEEAYDELIEDSNSAFTCILCENKRLETFMADRMIDSNNMKKMNYKGKPMIIPALVKRQDS